MSRQRRKNDGRFEQITDLFDLIVDLFFIWK